MTAKRVKQPEGTSRRGGTRFEIGASATRHIESGDHYRSRTTRRDPAGPPDTFDPDSAPGDTLSVFSVGPWWVLIELGDVDGQVEAIRIEIRGYADRDDPEAAPISATGLRLPFGDLIDRSRREYLGDARGFEERLARRPQDDDVAAVFAAARRHAAAAESTRGRAGRPRLEDTPELDKTIAAYETAVRAGSRTPNVHAGNAVDATAEAVAKRIARARALGLLPQTQRGVAKAWPKA
jgi:hypothetical protein